MDWQLVASYFTVKSTDIFYSAATSCQSISRYFYGRLLVEHFYKSRYGRVMLTDPKSVLQADARKTNGKWTGSWLPGILP